MNDSTSQLPARAEEATLIQTGNRKEVWEIAQREAMAWSKSTIIPKEFQGNISNCLVALEMAHRIGASPMQVMQNLYVVHGRPGWSSTFLIASVNHCGRFTALRYEERGEVGSDSYAVRAWAEEKRTGERLNGTWITWDMVKAEGWLSKPGSKWKTMPDQMFKYRAASFWQRTYAPEISMGLQTAEEVEDVVAVVEDVPRRPVRIGTLQMAEAKRGIDDGSWTIDDVLVRYPNLVDDQLNELRGIKEPIKLATA